MSAEINLLLNFPIGGANPFFLIAGPCVLENTELAISIGLKIREICNFHGVRYIFKASYDKANRTSPSSPRGPGLKQGIAMLREIKSSLHVPILTDVHETNQVEKAAEVVDILQIPAFLCRQTDLLITAGATGRAVNIKKGQFIASEDMKYAVEKVKQGGEVPVTLTERGTMFGYRDLVLDLRSLAIMRKFAPVVFDGTHTVQSPGGAGGKTGGNREWAPFLMRGAIATGVDGIFLEVHTDPESSPSDAANMITPQILEKHLPLWIELDRRVKSAGF